jgi:chloride channel protein, CIC family
LLACGAAAAISAVFNAPITGLIFAIEILLADVLVSNILFVMLASAVGLLLSQFIGQKHLLINAASLNLYLTKVDMLLLVLLSFVSALYCLYYVRVNAWVVSQINASRFGPLGKSLTGGLSLVLLIVFFPLLFGEGYHTIQYLVQGKTEQLFLHSFITVFDNPHINLILILLGSLLFKVIATSVTIHSGGNGGYFAPSLFVGAILGYTVAYLINISGLAQVNIVAFTLVGMAGTLSGIMFAPLTAVFLIAEVTGGYALFVPLMLVSSFSFFFVRHFDPNSVKNRASVFDSGKSESKIINTHQILLEPDQMLDNQVLLVHEHFSITDLIELIKLSKRNLFGVIDDKGALIGTIHLDDLKDYIFDPSRSTKHTIKNFIKTKNTPILTTDTLEMVLSKFEHSDQWYLPLFKENQFLGFASKRNVLTELRNLLARQSD